VSLVSAYGRFVSCIASNVGRVQGVQGDGIFCVATLMCPCVLKALGSFETSQNCDPATQCHISEDSNPQ
jgi:hypothetical protein